MTADGSFFLLCAVCVLAGVAIGVIGVAAKWDDAPAPEAATDATHDPGWIPVVPPRPGLRCWATTYDSRTTPYCEPDPTATFGASP